MPYELGFCGIVDMGSMSSINPGTQAFNNIKFNYVACKLLRTNKE